MSSVLRTQATGETAGFMKEVISTEDDRILGFTMIGSEAGEVMAAVLGALPYSKLRDAVIAHLTMAEGLGLGRTLHKPDIVSTTICNLMS